MAMRSLTFLLLLFHIKLHSVFGYPSVLDNKISSSSTQLYIPISFTSKTGYTGHDTVIPCRPISHEFNVTLHRLNHNINDDYVRVDQDSRISFDPKRGFMIKHITPNDEGRYKCRLKREANEESQCLTLNLDVCDPPEVKITMTPTYGIEGDDFNFECRISELDKKITNYSVHWRVPNGEMYPQQSPSDERISTSMNVVKDKAKSYLELKNVNINDSGGYKCEFESWGLRLEATTTVHVYANQLSSVRITNEPHYDGKIFEKLGTNIELSATIKTTLNTLEGMKVEWMHNSRCVIISNAQHQITYTNNSTTLLIRNFSDSDVGSYTVRVHNYQKTKLLGSDSAYLQVWG